MMIDDEYDEYDEYKDPTDAEEEEYELEERAYQLLDLVETDDPLMDYYIIMETLTIENAKKYCDENGEERE